MSVKSTDVENLLHERITTLKEQRAGLDIAIKEMESLLQGCAAPKPRSSYIPPKSQPESMRQQILNSLEVMLRQRGPMHREELKAALENQGLNVGTIQTLANYLSRDKRFVPVQKGNGVWALVSQRNAMQQPLPG